jgi:hypothetical protein
MISSVITERSPIGQAFAGSVTGGCSMSEEIPAVFDGVLSGVGGLGRGSPGLSIGVMGVRPEGASLHNHGLVGIGLLIGLGATPVISPYVNGEITGVANGLRVL